jgi:hypothetical protein
MSELLLPEDVFVTDGFPVHTYVAIDEGKPERDLREGLDQQNKIISIIGPSKSGKSTLCNKFFGTGKGSDKIYVTGDSIFKPDDLWHEAYRQASDDTDKSFFELSHNERIDHLLARELPLVIDDFHYIDRGIQGTVCRQLKNAASAGLRIVVLSTPHRGDDPVRSNPDLSGRYFAVNFRFWRLEDLTRIAEVGFTKVGLPSSSAFNQNLGREALTSPQIMQTLCLEVCRATSLDVPLEQTMVQDHNLSVVKSQSLRSYNLSTSLQLLVQGPPERGSKRLDYKLSDDTEADVYQILVRALRIDPPFNQLSLEDIKIRVRSFLKDERDPNIRGALQQIDNIYKDGAAPPIEWDDEKRQLTVVDPHFYFYLRNVQNLFE